MMETREAKAMSLVVAPDQRQARRSARQEIVRQVKLGATASEAQRRSPVPKEKRTGAWREDDRPRSEMGPTSGREYSTLLSKIC